MTSADLFTRISMAVPLIAEGIRQSVSLDYPPFPPEEGYDYSTSDQSYSYGANSWTVEVQFRVTCNWFTRLGESELTYASAETLAVAAWFEDRDTGQYVELSPSFCNEIGDALDALISNVCQFG